MTSFAKGHFKKVLASDCASNTYELSAGVSATREPSATRGGRIALRDRVGVNMFFVATGTDNYLFAAKIYAVKRVHNVNEGDGATSAASVFHRQLIGTVVGTIAGGIAMPTAGSVFASGTYGVDTLSFTADLGWTHLVNTLAGGSGAPAAYSPADNANLAVLTIPDVFDAEFIDIDFDIDSAGGGNYATGVNVLAETVR